MLLFYLFKCVLKMSLILLTFILIEVNVILISYWLKTPCHLQLNKHFIKKKKKNAHTHFLQLKPPKNAVPRRP